MTNSAFSIMVMLALFIMMAMGLGVLIWLSPIPASELTGGQQHLMSVVDGMVKIALGAILGFMGAIAFVSSRNRKSSS